MLESISEQHQQHNGSEEDPLLPAEKQTAPSKHSTPRKHSSDSLLSSWTIGFWPHLTTKQLLKLALSAVVLGVILSFVNAVKSQVNNPSGVHTIVAANALKRLNSNLQYTPLNKCVVTVLIARHCNNYGAYATDDVEHKDKHCSDVGYERARYLATQFAPAPGSQADKIQDRYSRWPTPVGLFALLPKEDDGGVNYRQMETLLPLAEQANVNIQVVGQPRHVATSLFGLLQTMPPATTDDDILSNNNLDDTMDDAIKHNDSAYCGQVFVVAWERASIPDLASALGCSPNQGCPGEYPDGAFDLVWQLRFVHQGSAPRTEKDIPRQWLPNHQSNKSSHLIVDEHHLLSAEQRAEQVQDEVTADADGDIYSNFSALVQEELQGVAKRDHDRKHGSSTPGWTVYGTVSQQDFDPLHVSYMQAQASLKQDRDEL